MSEYEPYARTAIWSRRLGLFAIPVSIIAVLAQRSERLEFEPSLAALGAGLLLAALAILLGLVAFAIIWAWGNRGTGAATAGVLAGVAILALPASYAIMAWNLPPIVDIATDPGNPPAFVFAAAERRPAENPLAYPGESAALTQIAAFPDIAPLRVSSPPDEVYAVALQLVKDRGWRILDDGASSSPRRIEAVAATPILRLLHDVVIEIKPEDGGGSRIDMRSASRVGDRDLGANAKRVRTFLTELAVAAR